MSSLDRTIRNIRSILVTIVAGALCACATMAVDRRPEVEAALQHYSQLMLRMDNAGIAGLIAGDGELKNSGQAPIYGPDAVRAFLDTFKDYRVLAYQIHADSTSVQADTARQSGTYRQRVLLPDKQTVEVSGRFDAVWVRTTDGRWLIHRMLTTPDHGKKPGKAAH